VKDIETLKREEREQQARIAAGSTCTPACRPGACVCRVGTKVSKRQVGFDFAQPAKPTPQMSLILDAVKKEAAPPASKPRPASEEGWQCLSFWEPWLQGAILRRHPLAKRIENRTAWTGCSYRGPLLLHASKGHGTLVDFTEAVETILEVLGLHLDDPNDDTAQVRAMRGVAESTRMTARGATWKPAKDLGRGAIVGRCRLDGVIRNEADFASYVANVPGAHAQRAWWFGGFALVLADVERLETPVTYSGKQGFFKVPNAVLADAKWTPCP
jgi:hypothetical protein